MWWMLLACRATIPTAAVTVEAVDKTWSTRSVPCGYVEVARTVAIDFSKQKAVDAVLGPVLRGEADAVIDYTIQRNTVKPPRAQCREIPECLASMEAFRGSVPELSQFTISGIAVRWLPET